MWWNDLGASVGWTSWLLMALGMLAFWGAVVVGLWALFEIPWPTHRRGLGEPRRDGVAGLGRDARSPRGMGQRQPMAGPTAASSAKPISSAPPADPGAPR
jgi:hypothetical protein